LLAGKEYQFHEIRTDKDAPISSFCGLKKLTKNTVPKLGIPVLPFGIS